jgi:hypothetical protein
MSGLHLDFPDELIDAIAKRTAELLLEMNGGSAVSPWFDVEGAAAYLQIPLGRFRNLSAAKEIRSSPQGKARTYHRSWLDEYALRQADLTP